jgi:hypothetical protein
MDICMKLEKVPRKAWYNFLTPSVRCCVGLGRMVNEVVGEEILEEVRNSYDFALLRYFDEQPRWRHRLIPCYPRPF